MWIVGDAWNENDAGVPLNFKRHALAKHRERWEWMTFPIHHVAYAVSPHYHNENCFAIQEVMKHVKEVFKHFSVSTGSYNRALSQFADYKNMRDPALFPTDDKGKIKLGMSPKKWWQLHGAQFGTLQQIALRVFSIGTSSSTSERNFSTWSHIWSNRANKLDFERTTKMVFVYTNLRALWKMRAGTNRTDNVDRSWLQNEIDE